MSSLLPRCMLYVPASNPRMLARAAQVPADALVFDLEDSVPGARKPEARRNVVEKLAEGEGEGSGGSGRRRPERFVRVNSLDTEFAMEDLLAVAPSPSLDGITLPKVETAADVLFAGGLLEQIARREGIARPRKLFACIESARAVVNLREICEAGVEKGWLHGLIFAAEDYAASTGVTRTPSLLELVHARQALVTYARAYRLSAIDLVCTALHKDNDAESAATLQRECQQGREFGFTGKQAIHPSQVAAIQETFGPSVERVRWARAVVARSVEEAAKGTGAFVHEGQVVDAPVVKEAQRIVGEADVLGMA